MIAMRETKTVREGKIIMNVPDNFGSEVEVIILSPETKEVQYWSESEIHAMGNIPLKKDFDNEDYTTKEIQQQVLQTEIA
ncbi:MAG: hypothetical protein KGZ58_01375 [Ignavibacteriales bacterium]|nr:hypothetical protein [Ignavibacteriales bacterium]